MKLLWSLAVLIVFGGHEANSAALLASELEADGNYTVEYLVESQGYPVETHKVTTYDGYILTVHRVPHGLTGRRNGKVVFLQHGILNSAADWLLMGAGKSLGFLLADEGYDVWFGNARGTTWSREHIALNISDSTFWQFSWHQIGTIDVPAMIDYALSITGNSSLYYAGHSQGTTVYYVLTSSLPEYNEKIKVGVHLAPIGFVNHMVSPVLKFVAMWEGSLETLTAMIGLNEFLPTNDFFKNFLGETICKEDSITKLLCSNSLFLVCGFSRSEMNDTLVPIMMKYTPAGSSIKQFFHYGQEIKSGHFRQYDYGTATNLKTYGTIHPPEYDLSKVTAPTYLIYSKNDWLAAESDVDKLCDKLGGSCEAKIVMSDFDFNHLDYMYGINAPSLVYNKVIGLFARY